MMMKSVDDFLKEKERNVTLFIWDVDFHEYLLERFLSKAISYEVKFT